jgi:hypothetical protein
MEKLEASMVAKRWIRIYYCLPQNENSGIIKAYVLERPVTLI